VVIALLAGVGEELLFRGVVLQAMSDVVGPEWGPWVGLAASSIVFGAAHLLTPAYGVLAGLIGFYLGGLWLATGTLTVPIVAHAMYDFVALWYLAKVRPRRLPPAE
jgi:membrane protease YdiL (CAAX protease family)